MPSGIENVFLIVTMGEFIVGQVGNAFIVLVNCIDWGKGRKLSTVDYLLTSLAISRINLLWILLLESFVLVLWPHLYTSDKVTALFSISWALNNHFSVWIATCLSVFYFLRIANLSHPSFHWLRQRISRVLLMLLLGSSLLLSFNFALSDTFTAFWTNWHRTHQENSSWPSDMTITLYVNSLVAFNFIYLIPLLLSLGSLVLLFVSLKRHTRNLHLSASCSDASTEAHKKAMHMVMSFLLLFLVHLTTTILVGWAFFIPYKYEAHLAFSLIMTLFPSGHSLILIMGHSKLRQTTLWLLGHLECSLRKKTG
ncbi:taste receptor type 2 member 7-like [Sorex fumeus]|uniref:taste receptor type 2 member 7-like n=1 Tax=Sorex fumeus TaxID=62283 RepID=UPI0024AD0565|nr:taste receptor type 2 member 7-like [Sorex fumeus]